MTVSLSQPYPLTVADCRGLVKTLVCGMKTITWGVGACKTSAGGVALYWWEWQQGGGGVGVAGRWGGGGGGGGGEEVWGRASGEEYCECCLVQHM